MTKIMHIMRADPMTSHATKMHMAAVFSRLSFIFLELVATVLFDACMNARGRRHLFPHSLLELSSIDGANVDLHAAYITSFDDSAT